MHSSRNWYRRMGRQRHRELSDERLEKQDLNLTSWFRCSKSELWKSPSRSYQDRVSHNDLKSSILNFWIFKPSDVSWDCFDFIQPIYEQYTYPWIHDFKSSKSIYQMEYGLIL
jgi:hypothetical protein